MRVGINGFGWMGRLALRAGWERGDLEFVAINEPGATIAVSAAMVVVSRLLCLPLARAERHALDVAPLST